MPSAIQADWVELAEEGYAVRQCLVLAEQDLSDKINGENISDFQGFNISEIDNIIEIWIAAYRHLPWATDLAEQLKQRIKSNLKHRAHRWLN